MAHATLSRRLLAEFLGTAFLVAAVVGSGIAAARRSPSDSGLQLLENSLATGAVLLALIVVFGSVSGAHFNPVVTLVDRELTGAHRGETAAYIAIQILGGVSGAIAANAMFGLSAVSISATTRATSSTFLAEVIATFGLSLVIFGLVRGGRGAWVPVAVAGYITGAYWFTSSTSFANPAVTIARVFSDTFAGIAPSSVLPFITAQLFGGLLALFAIKFLWPQVQPTMTVANLAREAS